MSGGRWWPRVAGAVAAFAGFEVLLTVIEADPDPIRLALLVAICTALLGLLVDALGGAEPSWRVEVERPSVRESGDPRLVRYVALIEAHLSSRTAEHALRDRLAQLADQVLRQRHGLHRDDPEAAQLLGPELVGVLSGPPRRLSRAEIDRCLTAIEEL
ncbi:hypothetical protein KM427_19305 [Nocardioides sp. LMS-CY]|uniref:Uncharacterized protein n=1 Tax=Nocardioides soli TaxID=1036020 RepID=A0A7W4Z332_9ACTN|nr:MULTISPECIES: hypothetical protein [Nocardioides]MBB3043265.1 hypothetical protein [Nocardioides soli]QWF21076.1 hypothetical protein KM427_19305 [Nocardioides sp. LMS-CY]